MPNESRNLPSQRIARGADKQRLHQAVVGENDPRFDFVLVGVFDQNPPGRIARRSCRLSSSAPSCPRSCPWPRHRAACSCRAGSFRPSCRRSPGTPCPGNRRSPGGPYCRPSFSAFRASACPASRCGNPMPAGRYSSQVCARVVRRQARHKSRARSARKQSACDVLQEGSQWPGSAVVSRPFRRAQIES